MEPFDLTIVGAGPGGYVAAIRAAQLGMKVAVVEKDPVLGGTCLRVGCIPSKALLESSELFALARERFAEHGIISQGVTLDLDSMMNRKAEVVKELTDGIGLLMKKHKIKLFTGAGSLKAPGSVEVASGDGKQLLQSRFVLLATGSVPVELPHIPFDGANIVTSTEALSFSRVPRKLVVVGAGAVGLELGSVWRRLGSEVTVLEMLPDAAPFADVQMSKMLARCLRKQGIEILTRTRLEEARVAEDRVVVRTTDSKGKSEELVCHPLLVSVGRRPNTAGLGLELLGIRLDEKGRLVVDERFETTLPGVYAIGDIVAGPMLAHKASEEGIAVAEILSGRPGHVNYDVMPNVIYTHPELAQVGLTEEQAKEKGLAARVGRFYFKGNGRAKSMAEEDGLVKILADAETGSIVGVHILGPKASELIAEAAVAMQMGGSAEDLARVCHAHPTLSESIKEAALAVDKRAIHG